MGRAPSTTAFLGAFPDVKFELVDIAIGPQGVIEIVDMTGTHRGEWAGIAPTGEPVSLRIVIHFPWDPDAERFAGENVYFDAGALRGAGANRQRCECHYSGSLFPRIGSRRSYHYRYNFRCCRKYQCAICFTLGHY